jgi:hypothetical protein
MNKNKISFFSYLLLSGMMAVGYTRCSCSTPLSPDTNPSPADSAEPPSDTASPITQEMIDKVQVAVNNGTVPQFFLDRLLELKNGDTSKIDEANPDKNVIDNNALLYAVNLEDPSIVGALLKLGANPAKRNQLYRNPLYAAIEALDTVDSGKLKAFLEIVELFLAHPDITKFINKRSTKSITPLKELEDIIGNLDLTNPNHYPIILSLLSIREKMLDKGAAYR